MSNVRQESFLDNGHLPSRFYLSPQPPPGAFGKAGGPEYPTQDAAIEAARERGLTLCGRTLIYTRESGLCAVLHYNTPKVSPS